MKFKKLVCALSSIVIAFMTSVFAMDEPPAEGAINELKEYLLGLCAKVVDVENNTNPYAKWVREHCSDYSPSEQKKILYQLWCSGGALHATNGNDSLRLSRDVAEHFAHFAAQKLKICVCVIRPDYPVYKRLQMLQQITKAIINSPGHFCFMNSLSGMGAWSLLKWKELGLAAGLHELREFIERLGAVDQSSDFFGNCLFGSLLAARKCSELRLRFEILFNDGHFFTSCYDSSGGRYMINYTIAVRKLAHGQLDEARQVILQPWHDFEAYCRGREITNINGVYQVISLDHKAPYEEPAEKHLLPAFRLLG